MSEINTSDGAMLSQDNYLSKTLCYGNLGLPQNHDAIISWTSEAYEDLGVEELFFEESETISQPAVFLEE